MPEPAVQSYASHRRFVPLHHFVAGPILLLNLLWAFVRIYHAWRGEARFDRLNSIVELLLAFALVLLWVYLRTFALTVQDRVIRLEMRQRLAEVLSADLRARIPELAPGQLIALRFASDEELPELTRKVLDEKIRSRDAIKQLVRNWQADHLRV
jgi:Family of unknown function (DUF6526)